MPVNNADYALFKVDRLTLVSLKGTFKMKEVFKVNQGFVCDRVCDLITFKVNGARYRTIAETIQ